MKIALFDVKILNFRAQTNPDVKNFDKLVLAPSTDPTIGLPVNSCLWSLGRKYIGLGMGSDDLHESKVAKLLSSLVLISKILK